MFKKILLCLLMVGGILTVAEARVAANLKMNRFVYMQYDTVLTKIAIRNDSGRPLVFGTDEKLKGEVIFIVEDVASGRRLKPIPGRRVDLTGTVLQAGESKEIVIALSQYFRLNKLGQYRVTAFIRHPSFTQDYQTNDCPFDISNGSLVWTRTLGVPEYLSENLPPGATRTYSVRLLKENGINNYYLIIEDKKRVYAMYCLGEALGDEKVSCEVDDSNVHILFAATTKEKKYIVYSINGKKVMEKYYRTSDTAPILVRDKENGLLSVVGGLEVKSLTGYVRDTDEK